MDWKTFVSSLVDSLAWPAIIFLALWLFREPFAVVIQSLKKFKYKDFEFELEDKEETADGDKDLDMLISSIQTKSHSLRWLRRNTPINLTDEQFQEIIKEKQTILKFTRIRRYDKNGKRIIPGWPGVKYIGKRD